MKIPFSVKRRFVDLLVKLCDITHLLNLEKLEFNLTGRCCNLALLSFTLDEKWGTNVWEECDNEKREDKNFTVL